MPARRRVVRSIAIAVFGILVVPLALAAHAHLRRSEPSARDRLTTAPTAIRLWFSERPQLAFTRVSVRAADSSTVPVGPLAAMANDQLGVTAPVASPLANGEYTVLWQTGSADGHPVRGSFSFTVAVPVPQPAADAAADTNRIAPKGNEVVEVQRAAEPTTLKAYVAARWLELIALFAVIGVVVFRSLVARVMTAGLAPRGGDAAFAAAPITDGARKLGQYALVLAFAGALARLSGEISMMLDASSAIDASAIRSIVTGTTWGIGWIIGCAGIVLAAVGFTLASRAAIGWTLAALGTFAMAVAPALTGHAAAAQPIALAVSIDVVHVLAAGAWLGTLLTIVVVGMPALLRPALASAEGSLLAPLVRAFHPLALTCAIGVVLSGVVTSWLHLPTVASLWESAYGRVLLTKVALVAIVAVLGGINWRRQLPALGNNGEATSFRRTAAAELAFAALVLFATAFLSSIETP